MNNSECKLTFEVDFLVIFHIFLANCLSNGIRSTLFLSHRVVDKELVVGVEEISALIFHVNLWFKLQFLIIHFVRVIQLK